MKAPPRLYLEESDTRELDREITLRETSLSKLGRDIRRGAMPRIAFRSMDLEIKRECKWRSCVDRKFLLRMEWFPKMTTIFDEHRRVREKSHPGR